MGMKLNLDGAMIPRSVKRMFDQRSEPRAAAGRPEATFEWRGTQQKVPLLNLSPSGAMLEFAEVPRIGEQVALRIADRGALAGRIQWARDGHIGIHFDPRVG